MRWWRRNGDFFHFTLRPVLRGDTGSEMESWKLSMLSFCAYNWCFNVHKVRYHGGFQYGLVLFPPHPRSSEVGSYPTEKTAKEPGKFPSYSVLVIKHYLPVVIPKNPQREMTPALIVLKATLPGTPCFQQTYPSTKAKYPKDAITTSIASKWSPKYKPHSAKPTTVTRAEPDTITGWAGLETAIFSLKPNVRMAFSAFQRGAVPPMVMIVASRRGGMWRGMKCSNMLNSTFGEFDDVVWWDAGIAKVGMQLLDLLKIFQGENAILMILCIWNCALNSILRRDSHKQM